MFETIRKSVEQWNNTTTERAKLQHTYIAVAIASILVAGLVGLVNYELGQQLVAFALLCAAVFLINALTWALLSGLVIVKLDSQPKAQAKAQATKAATKSNNK